MLGETSPAWGREITRELAVTLETATVSELPGVGHAALEAAPELLAAEILRFLGSRTPAGG